MSRKHDRAAELRAIADGRLMLNVRNGVTVARSMLARIADEFETMSTALAAKDVELAAERAALRLAADRADRAEAQLAEARKALSAKVPKFAPAADLKIQQMNGMDAYTKGWRDALIAARRALNAGGSDE